MKEKNFITTHGTTMFLRLAVFIAGAVVLGLCIFVLPAGVNDSEAGPYRPILVGMYVTAIPFFIALYQTLRLLNYVDKNQAFSQLSTKALKYIKYCAATIGALYVIGLPYIYTAAQYDDAPGVLALGMIVSFASFMIAGFAAVLQKLLQNVIDIKSENDLTV